MGNTKVYFHHSSKVFLEWPDSWQRLVEVDYRVTQRKLRRNCKNKLIVAHDMWYYLINKTTVIGDLSFLTLTSSGINKFLLNSFFLYQTLLTSTKLYKPLSDSPNLYQTHPTSTRLTQTLRDSPNSLNLYKIHQTSTRLTQPLPNLPNLYQIYTTSTRLTQPPKDSPNLS